MVIDIQSCFTGTLFQKSTIKLYQIRCDTVPCLNMCSVYEKEREWGHDPTAPEDTPFGEYMRK